VITYKNIVLIFFEAEIWNNSILPLFVSNIWVKRRKCICYVFHCQCLANAMTVSVFVCVALVTEFCLKVRREKTWDIHLPASLDFSGFVGIGCKNWPGRPNREQINLTLQSIAASKLLDNSDISPRYSACWSKNWRNGSRS